MGWFTREKKKDRQYGELVPVLPDGMDEPYIEDPRPRPAAHEGESGKLAITFMRNRMVVETCHQVVDVPPEIRRLMHDDPVKLQLWAERHILPAMDEWQTRDISSTLTFSATEAR